MNPPFQITPSGEIIPAEPEPQAPSLRGHVAFLGAPLFEFGVVLNHVDGIYIIGRSCGCCTVACTEHGFIDCGEIGSRTMLHVVQGGRA